jgi:hypothetical protein
MYAHTSTALYEVDPSPPYAVTLVGNFNGQTPLLGMTDIAIDLQGNMWGIAFTGVYRIDPQTATVTQVSGGLFGDYNSLTFVTNGTLYAGEGSTLYTVNTTNGTLNSAGTVGGLVFAGDMVGLPDGLMYCLMAANAQSGTPTSLVVYDPANQSVVDSNPTGQGSMYGVGYALNQIFGFTEGGQIFLVDDVNGTSSVVASPGQAFWGAATNPTRWSE